MLYYSQTSNTKAVAQEIAKQLKADIEEIVPVKPYDGDFQATIDRCKQDQKDGVKPEIKPLKSKLKKYKVIFLGFPVWFGTYAPPIATLLDKVDLSGKTIVPFCTFGSGGLESSAAYLAQAQPKAKILDGYGVRAARMDAMPKEVDQFLKASGFVKGEYVKLDDFSASHRVSNDEAAIYDAAIGDYPMMQNTRPLFVASRSIPDGTEYLFTACEKRKEPVDPNMSMRPPKEMQVYVIVLDGKAPVFTKVVR
ncbi:MAG: NAD(P)H-dependent oxidoreductase [Muribaculaceae bacterium]|nr:NAD(P)H-dependent oxidoreductase [Muribaculaceae bacterium]